MADDLKRICFYMKDAMFAAGDVLMQRRGDEKAAMAAGDAAAKALLTRWFAVHEEEVVIAAQDSGAVYVARRHGGSYIVEDTDMDISTFSGVCFVVDGLRGRIAFERGMDRFCSCAAYMRGGKAMAGAVYDPVHVKLYHAAQMLGAYCNGARITVSDADDLINGVVAVDAKTLRTACPDALGRLAQQTKHMCTEEACPLAMCRVASGCIDAAVCAGRRFDGHAAGVLIAAEAGAVVTDRAGGTLLPGTEMLQGIVAAAPGISGALCAVTALF